METDRSERIEEKKGTGGPYALLWDISGGSRSAYATAFAFMFLALFFNFLLPQVIRYVVDVVIGDAGPEGIPFVPLLLGPFHRGGARSGLLLSGALVLAIAAAGGLCNFAYHRSVAVGAEDIVKRLRDRLYVHIQNLPYSWHIAAQTGDIIQRCTADVEIVRNFVFVQLTEMVRTVALVVLAYAILLPMNAPMAAASFLFLPVLFLYSFLFLRRVSQRFLAADEAEGELLSIAQENFTGVRVVRAFGRERYEVDRFDRQNRTFAELWMELGKLLSTYWGLGELLIGLQMTTLCVLGAYQAAQGGITVGGFIVFLTYNSMTVWPVRALGRVLSEASKTGVSLGRLREILDTPQETDPPDALETPIHGDIEFDRVSFSYGEQKILDAVSFRLPAGATLGILGATSSGKSTIAYLLCRLYDLADGDGTIRIGGTDIARYQRRWLRANVGIVLQEPYLYSRTIRENIASLSPEHSLEDVRRAAETAQVDRAILQFANGYDTLVGERGVTLSGGQKQRVAIARTILKAPPIMIFDDSLSAVDTETDAKIRAALRERTGQATTLIIAHRITSISSADLVIVMQEGRIAEMGPPAELLLRDGIYRRLHDLQESIEEEADEEASA